MNRSILLVLGMIVAGLSSPTLAKFPSLTGRVVDAANVIPEAEEAALNARLAEIETATTHQVVVATVPSLDGLTIAEYGYKLGRTWKIGDKTRNDGAILLLATNDRKVRIEVGYGLEGVLTDASAALILKRSVTPKLKAKDIPGALAAGVEGIAREITPAPATVLAAVAEPVGDRATSEDQNQSSAGGAVIFFGLFLVGAVALLVYVAIKTRREAAQRALEREEIERREENRRRLEQMEEQDRKQKRTDDAVRVTLDRDYDAFLTRVAQEQPQTAATHRARNTSSVPPKAIVPDTDRMRRRDQDRQEQELQQLARERRENDEREEQQRRDRRRREDEEEESAARRRADDDNRNSSSIWDSSPSSSSSNDSWGGGGGGDFGGGGSDASY